MQRINTYLKRLAGLALLGVGIGTLVLGTPTQAAPLPKDSEDIRAGYRIARDICRTCHVIDPAQTSRPILRQPGPNFEDIANRPGLTAPALRHLIASQSWDTQSRPVQMPRQAISERSTAQVAAYILSLRKSS
jgi:mono/diheme cytochrome c family protein